VGIGMNGNKEISLLGIGNGRSLFKGQEGIILSGEHDLAVKLLFNLPFKLFCNF